MGRIHIVVSLDENDTEIITEVPFTPEEELARDLEEEQANG